MQILNWHLTDSEQLFDYHLKNFPEIFQRFVEDPITYSINSDGFRSEFEFKPNKGLEVDIFLGCSHTLGSGHYWENTWPFVVSQYTGNKIVNLAEGGSGIERAFFNLLKYRDYFNIKNIFHHQPLYPRYDFIDFHSRDFYDNKPFRFFPFQPAWDGDEPGYAPYSEEYMHKVLLSERFMYYNHIKYVMAIQGIAHELGVPYYFHHPYPKGSWAPRTVFEYDYVAVNEAGRKLEGIVNTNGFIIPDDDIIARDSTHFTVKQIKAVGHEMVHLKKTCPEGFKHIIPYKQKIFPKNSP
tara:strand:- start:916 stop:1800 length:885 start_codon:yes stop_codon:yes gene_type:complete